MEIKKKNPLQPIYEDEDGIARFKENKIVHYLQELASKNGCSLNELITMDFNQDDWIQFSQLIGYSLLGFGELSYVDDEAYSLAEDMLKSTKNTELELRNQVLREKLEKAKEATKDLAQALFEIHRDDLDDL